MDTNQWQTAANSDLIGADLSKGFIVAGISAGANISAVISHLYRDEKLQPPLTGIYLSIPSAVDASVVPGKYRAEYLSREQNKNAPILSEAAMLMFRSTSTLMQAFVENILTKRLSLECYDPDPASPLMSPLLFPSGHTSLPPTYFQVCGMDPLRDEGLIYEHVLREECGVATRLDLYPGLPHGKVLSKVVPIGDER